MSSTSRLSSSVTPSAISTLVSTAISIGTLPPTPSSTAPAPAATTATGPKLADQLIQSSSLVWRVSLLLYALIAVLVALRIPHLIGLFGTSDEWRSGHLLRYVKPRTNKAAERARAKARAMQRNDSARTVVGDDPEYTTKDSGGIPMAEYHTHTHHRPRPPRKTFLFPAHVPSVPPSLRQLLVHSRSPFPGLPGYTLGQVALLTGYFTVLLGATLYRSSPFVDATRPAWVAVSQVPLVLALAQKNSVVGGLLGYGYERLNYIHRFVGRLVVLGSNLHAIYYLYKWTITSTLSRSIAAPKNAWGLALLLAMDVLYIFSTSFWRRGAYRVFRASHWVGVVVVIPGIYMHQPSLWIYALISASIYALDRILRLIKTRITTAYILPPGSSANTTRVVVPSINTGWRAGQHVRLRVLSVGGPMGWFGWMEAHPFTIASAPGALGVSSRGRGGRGASVSGGRGTSRGGNGRNGSTRRDARDGIGGRETGETEWTGGDGEGQEGLLLLIKKAGDWTGALARLAAGGGYVGSPSSSSSGEEEKEKGSFTHAPSRSKSNARANSQSQSKPRPRGSRRPIARTGTGPTHSPSKSTRIARVTKDVESLTPLPTRIRVWVEGPYGGPGRTVFSSFSGMLIVCGGSGISWGMGVVRDLVRKDAKGEGRVKGVEVVWVVGGVGEVCEGGEGGFGGERRGRQKSVLEELVELVEEAAFNKSKYGRGRMDVRVSVSFTRAPDGAAVERFKDVIVRIARGQVGAYSEGLSSNFQNSASNSSSNPNSSGNTNQNTNQNPNSSREDRAKDRDREPEMEDSFDLDLEDVDVSTRPVAVHPGVIVSPGRPRLSKFLDSILTRAAVLNPGDPEQDEVDGMKGVVVGVCGPGSLGADVVKAVEAVGRERRERVGGVEVFEEGFGM